MSSIIQKYKSFAIAILIGLNVFYISSCSVRKHLKSDQIFLDKQEVTGNKNFDDSELAVLFEPKINRKFIFFRLYLHAYYLGLSKFDTAKVLRQKEEIEKKYAQKLSALNDTLYLKSLAQNSFYENNLDSNFSNKKVLKKIKKIRNKRDKKLNQKELKLTKGNWMMRVVGEPPALWDSASTAENGLKIKNFYQKKGYLDCEVKIKVDTIRQYASETYTIIENPVYKINKVEFHCSDTTLRSIYDKYIKQSLIKKGDKYIEQKFVNERDRLNKLFKDNGYYDFLPQYISYELDSNTAKHTINVETIVANPTNNTLHQRYKLEKIYYHTDFGYNTGIRDTHFYKNIEYVYSKDNFSKRIIERKLQFKKDKYYSVTEVQNSQRQLAGLDMYKFININFEKVPKSTDSTYQGLIAYVRTMPLKKFQSTEELGLSMASNFIPGPSASLNFKSRNTFRGFESYELIVRATIVGQASLLSQSQFYRSEEYYIQNIISFPQLYVPLNKKLQNFIELYNPYTRFSASYTNVKRPEYTRDNINVGMVYNLDVSKKEQLSFAIVDINLIATKNKSTDFENYLLLLQSNGNNLLNSFGTSLVTDINTTYTFTNNTLGETKKSKYIRLYAESGGTMLNILNATNLLKATDTIFGLKTFRYFKFNTDFRFYYPVGKNIFAMRYNIGIARAYDQEQILPFERNFFLGGGNSLRAWSPRRMGPGSYVTARDANGKPIYQFEQPGNLMLEMSWEYRFKVIKFLESALFVDAGNLWIFAPRSGVEKARPEGVFYFDKFMSQIAIGTGIGVRLNFSFLVLRFDFGLKAKEPSNPEGERWVFLKSGYRVPNVNLSIGYPF